MLLSNSIKQTNKHKYVVTAGKLNPVRSTWNMHLEGIISVF